MKFIPEDFMGLTGKILMWPQAWQDMADQANKKLSMLKTIGSRMKKRKPVKTFMHIYGSIDGKTKALVARNIEVTSKPIMFDVSNFAYTYIIAVKGKKLPEPKLED